MPIRIRAYRPPHSIQWTLRRLTHLPGEERQSEHHPFAARGHHRVQPFRRINLKATICRHRYDQQHPRNRHRQRQGKAIRRSPSWDIPNAHFHSQTERPLPVAPLFAPHLFFGKPSYEYICISASSAALRPALAHIFKSTARLLRNFLEAPLTPRFTAKTVHPPYRNFSGS